MSHEIKKLHSTLEHVTDLHEEVEQLLAEAQNEENREELHKKISSLRARHADLRKRVEV